LDEHEITFMSSVPSVWRIAIKTAQPPQSRVLERVHCGSAPLSGVLWKGIQQWTGTDDVCNAYGITETGSWLAGTAASEVSPADGLIGEAWGGVIRVLSLGNTNEVPAGEHECEVAQSGYVWVNTPALMKGYLDRDDLTAGVVSNGWFLTGDIGLVDEDGRLFLKGREREEINRGGMKVYPGDIDSVVERFEETVDVCCFGCEDPLLGENVGVAVVLSSQNEDVLRGLHAWTERHLAKHQMPVKWYLMEEIPRTSRGKINRALVAKRCADLPEVDFPQVMKGKRGSTG
jgi:acyl-CoA synthetase (AMP-forming)/AMP-acid ligase II